MKRHSALAVICAAFLAACGSTVQSQPSVVSGLPGPTAEAGGDSGLSVPPPASPGLDAQGIPDNSAGRLPAPTSDGQQAVRGGGPNALPNGGATGAPKPISIGFFNTNNAQINSQYGYSVPQGEDIDRALVKAINAAGGLAGHKLDAHFDTYSADSHSYASDAAAACQSFTVDNHVSIVISPTVSTGYGFADCLQRKGVLLESSWPTDARSLANHPLLFSAAGSTFEHGYITALDQLHASGNLTTKNHLGVLLEGCPDDLRAWSTGIQPEIHRLGLPVELSTLSCTAGIQDAGAASAAIQGAVLKWRGAGVDRVLFVSAYESTLLVLFALEAESQHFRPGYVLSSSAGASGVATGGSFPSGQRPGLRGAGTLPGFDVDRPPAPIPVEKRCVTLARAGGVQMQSSFDREILYNHCASLFLFAAALKAISPASSNAAIQSAIQGLGTKVPLPGLVDGRTYLQADRHDAPAYAREFGWQAGCNCLTYLGPAVQTSG